MPQRLNDEGIYRGKPLEWGVGETKNHYPQFQCELETTERYDPIAEEWDVFEGETILAYICYSGSKGEIDWQVDNLKEAFGYNNEPDFHVWLNDSDFSKAVVQFRVELESYKGKERLKVKQILRVDAKVGGKIKKMDAEGLAKLRTAAPISAGPVKTEVTADAETVPPIDASDIPF